MLKVIKINEIEGDLTVDTTLVSVDNTIITVDVTVIGNSYQIKLPYRFFSQDIKFVLWNEIKETESILELQVEEENGLMVINFNFDFQDADSFEAKITDLENKLIWRGKLFATTQTDLENYILHKKDNGIIKI